MIKAALLFGFLVLMQDGPTARSASHCRTIQSGSTKPRRYVDQCVGRRRSGLFGLG